MGIRDSSSSVVNSYTCRKLEEISTKTVSYTHLDVYKRQEILTAIPVKEIAIYLPDEEFVNITKGVLLRKSQIVNISGDGLYTMTDGSVFQGRKRNISQHKQLRQALGLSKEQDAKAEKKMCIRDRYQ